MSQDLTLNLADCGTLPQLATALGVNAEVLELLAGDSRSNHYQVHKIPKRSARRRGQHRLVYEPGTEELRHFHRTLARRLAIYASQIDPTFPSVASFGYIRRKSIKGNATVHRGAPLLLRADIKDFFQSVSLERTDAIFRNLRIKGNFATILARVLCLHGSLAPGLAAAPLLANLACHELDARMMALAERYGAKYSRYADDISMSGHSLPGKSEIISTLAAEGFELSDTKYRVTKRGQSQFVTGLSITDAAGPHVPKAMKRRLRQELYYCEKRGVTAHLSKLSEPLPHGVARLDGTVRYVSFIEDRLRKSLRERWDRIASGEDLQIRPLPKHDRPPIQQYLVVDETDIGLQDGTRYLALGGVLLSEREAIENAIDRVLGDYIADPFSSGKKGEVRKQGLHFSEAHPELRQAFISQMPALPYRAYVVLRRYDAAMDYESMYLDLLKSLLEKLFYKCDRQSLEVSIEQNSSLVQDRVRSAVELLYDAFKNGGIARPLASPTVRIVDKRERLVSLPDFMLGVLSRYLREKPEESSQGRLAFERLRDRYSLIFDFDRRVGYNRRRPFSPAELVMPQSLPKT